MIHATTPNVIVIHSFNDLTEDWFAFLLKQSVDFVIYPPHKELSV